MNKGNAQRLLHVRVGTRRSYLEFDPRGNLTWAGMNIFVDDEFKQVDSNDRNPLDIQSVSRNAPRPLVCFAYKCQVCRRSTLQEGGAK